MPAYTPKPIDTAAVTLAPDQIELIEQLAKNAHETWAAKRLADGWTLGGRIRNESESKGIGDAVPGSVRTSGRWRTMTPCRGAPASDNGSFG